MGGSREEEENGGIRRSMGRIFEFFGREEM